MILKCESCIESWIFPTFFDWLLFIPGPRPLNMEWRKIATYEITSTRTSESLVIHGHFFSSFYYICSWHWHLESKWFNRILLYRKVSRKKFWQFKWFYSSLLYRKVSLKGFDNLNDSTVLCSIGNSPGKVLTI